MQTTCFFIWIYNLCCSNTAAQFRNLKKGNLVISQNLAFLHFDKFCKFSLNAYKTVFKSIYNFYLTLLEYLFIIQYFLLNADFFLIILVVEHLYGYFHLFRKLTDNYYWLITSASSLQWFFPCKKMKFEIFVSWQFSIVISALYLMNSKEKW